MGCDTGRLADLCRPPSPRLADPSEPSGSGGMHRRARWSANRNAAALPAVARTAEDLQVLRLAAAAHAHRDDVVELQLHGAAAVAAATTITGPHEVPDIVRDRTPNTLLAVSYTHLTLPTILRV